MNLRKFYMPKYVEEFRCICGECEDTCCAGWGSIVIDDKTIRKYKAISEPALKELLEKNINSVPGKKMHAIQLDSNSSCPFLTKEKSCLIQLKKGAEYLSDICAAYPRVANNINGVIQKSLVVSCPEAARLALLNECGIKFIETEEAPDYRLIVSNTIDTTLEEHKDNPVRYYNQIRNFVVNTLQDRSYELWERLIILGLFTEKLDKLFQNKVIDHVPQLINSHTEVIKNGDFKPILATIPVAYAAQMELLIPLALNLHEKAGQRYKDCLKETLAGIDFSPTKEESLIIANYRNAFEKYYLPFMKEHQYILENYLINHVFTTQFPIDSKSVFDKYVVMVFNYSLIKLHLIGISGFRQGLDKETVVKLIQSYTKTLEHNALDLAKTIKWFKELGYDKMAFMCTWIKN